MEAQALLSQLLWACKNAHKGYFMWPESLKKIKQYETELLTIAANVKRDKPLDVLQLHWYRKELEAFHVKIEYEESIGPISSLENKLMEKRDLRRAMQYK